MKMKIIICVIIFSMGVIISSGFSETKTDIMKLFDSANKLYEQGKYGEAEEEYNKILNMGFQSGPLYYNLGNTYFKLGLLGKTVLNYEKAKRLNPRNPELRFNYNYVQSMLKDKIEGGRKNWAIRNLENISELLPFGKWLGYTAILWMMFIGIVFIRILFPVVKKTIKYMTSIVLIFLAVSVICVIVNYNVYSSPSAIILPKEVTVYYGPGEAEVEAFLLHEGTKVEILKEQKDWCQIQLPDEKTGWLSKDTLGMI